MRLKFRAAIVDKGIATSFLLLLAVGTFLIVLPDYAHADVDGSLKAIRSKLTVVILPVLAVISICWAAFSLMTGNERAKTHIWYAVAGSALAFGAQSVVDFISQTVR